MTEAAQVDAAEGEGEERRAGDQPDDDQGDVGTADRERDEDELGDEARDRGEGLINGSVDPRRRRRGVEDCGVGRRGQGDSPVGGKEAAADRVPGSALSC